MIWTNTILTDEGKYIYGYRFRMLIHVDYRASQKKLVARGLIAEGRLPSKFASWKRVDHGF